MRQQRRLIKLLPSILSISTTSVGMFLLSHVFKGIVLDGMFFVFLFVQFGWTHVTLLIIVTQSHLFMQNVFEGIIW